ncbi:MAG TPA: group 1 truncated hemoglobin [Pseudolabrys sp.]|nr:group 1 truncated hemoglobin [Pseudolabrys sp.]
MKTIRNILVAASIAAAAATQPAAAQDKSLYQRLGGYDAIAAVTDEFIGRLATDEQEKRFFIGFSADSKARIRQHIVDFLCKAAGGPCVYIGRDMKTAHAGSAISKADWDRSVKILIEVLGKFKVPDKEQHELFAMLVPLEKDIVEK